MIFGQTKLEMKVGVFVFFGIILLAMFVLMIGNIKTWTSGYNVRVHFGFVNGVKLGAPVRFAGVDVGEVKSIKVMNRAGQKPYVELLVWVLREVRIPSDSLVWINTLGLLGEKYVEIMPGVDQYHFAKPNEVLVGKDPISMQEVTDMAKSIGDHANEVITKILNKEGTIGKLLYDDALYMDLERAINSKEGTIGRLLYDDSIYKKLEEMIADIKAHPWKLFFKGKEDKKK
jgi:phospholipid/cholesterol/gamma-HCH transport system substrate-binding protein